MFREDQQWCAEEWLTEAPSYDSGVVVGQVAQSEARAPGHLTRLEQTVVAMSLFDHPSSIEPPRPLMRGLMRVLGLRPVNRLSDRRLETLRRYCILLRLAGGTSADEEIRRMRDADFSDGALDQIGRLVAPVPQAGARRERLAVSAPT